MPTKTPPASPASVSIAPSANVRTVTRCRACQSPVLVPYLALGDQAPANAFRDPADQTPEFTAPLTIQWCSVCGLSQLTRVVHPELLYRHYVYQSGVSAGWHAHAEQLAASLGTRHPSGFVVDIASNDGTLLEHCQAHGHTVLGVEPATNLATAASVPTLATFWSREVAEGIRRFHGSADVIVAQNVFGHVDDAADFLRGVRVLLATDGICLIECPHILPLLEQTAFDTIYHEHLSYWSLRALQHVAAVAGLAVTDVQTFPDLHGGTVRYTLQRDHIPLTLAGQALLEAETDLWRQGITPYQAFATRARMVIQDFQETVTLAREAGNVVWGLGAAAKGNVLLQASQAPLEAVADDTPAKQGLLTPGTHVPVRPIREVTQASLLAILAWNWAPQLQAVARQAGFQGEFLTVAPSQVP